MKLPIIIALILGSLASMHAQKEENSSMADCPMMKDHAAMNERGDKAMGFLQNKTTHHFRLAEDGGAIEVSTNDPNDEASRSEIRGHLGHVAKMFEHGNFDIPKLVHGRMPDGAAVMEQQKANISYHYEPTKVGGLVRIRTSNPAALKAVHQFLRFQITEHKTGDSTEMGEKS